LESSGCEIKEERSKEESDVMNYAKWLVEVPSEITNDPIWKLEVYRFGLFAGDIGLQDIYFIAKQRSHQGVAVSVGVAVDVAV
jgi:hypothetical protein